MIAQKRSLSEKLFDAFVDRCPEALADGAYAPAEKAAVLFSHCVLADKDHAKAASYVDEALALVEGLRKSGADADFVERCKSLFELRAEHLRERAAKTRHSPPAPAPTFAPTAPSSSAPAFAPEPRLPADTFSAPAPAADSPGERAALALLEKTGGSGDPASAAAALRAIACSMARDLEGFDARRRGVEVSIFIRDISEAMEGWSSHGKLTEPARSVLRMAMEVAGFGGPNLGKLLGDA